MFCTAKRAGIMEQILTFLSQHPVLTTALIVVLIATIGNELVIAARSGHKLAPLDAVRLINDRDPIIVDVRSASDYKKSRLNRAVNLPISRLDEADAIIGTDKSRPLLLYCALGTTANSARDKLLQQGWTDVYPMRGGLNAWQGANLPVASNQAKAKQPSKAAQKKAKQSKAKQAKGSKAA
ncbi:rhodanese-like domain-containing protein [bacterium]|nr:rhodanese-like domain-containing protein [bacterium]